MANRVYMGEMQKAVEFAVINNGMMFKMPGFNTLYMKVHKGLSQYYLELESGDLTSVYDIHFEVIPLRKGATVHIDQGD